MRVKNTGVEKIYIGQTLATNQEYDLESTEISKWQNDSVVIQDLSTMLLLIGDGVTYQPTGASAVNYLLGTGVKEVVISSNPTFTSKKVGTKSLYTRAHGQVVQVDGGGVANTIDFNIPYNQVKFNAIEVVNCQAIDTISLQVLDTPTGTISTVANYMLNQFGFDISLPNGFYQRESKYDADLIKDMKIRVIYKCSDSKSIGINYILHEVKA